MLGKAPRLRALVTEQRRRHANALWLAAAAAATVSAASVALLGLSGWFITGAALAGAAGSTVVQSFNYLTPAATIRLLAILRTGSRYFERIGSHAVALKALAALRPRLFSALAAAPPRESLALSGGEASARLVQDVDAIESLFVRLSNPWAFGAALVMGLGLTALAGWAPAVLLAVFIGAGLATARLMATGRASKPAAEIQRRTGELKDTVAALAAAAPELRCYGLEDWAIAEIDRKGHALGETKVKLASVQADIAIVQSLLAGVAVALVVAASQASSLPLAALAGLVAVITLESVASAVKAFEQDGAVEAAADRLEPLLAHGLASRPRRRLTVPSLPLAGQTLRPGERVLLAGPSGCGKTTLIEQLLGLREGGPVVDRAAFAWAPQDAALLAGSVRENLLLACSDADETMLWEALHDAGLDTRVRELPQGLDSWVGENGARLSGGERRRLSLARALLRPAPWLLLDEPTEGLDDFTEALVLRRLRQRLEATGQGLVLVSHRTPPAILVERRIDLDPGSTAKRLGI
ncbi:MAG: ATP-binding cassette domain-containing protein [Caulobacter sp.]|nr:ATP-binding cassette domain-containing protein [Caulobacter sp.]